MDPNGQQLEPVGSLLLLLNGKFFLESLCEQLHLHSMYINALYILGTHPILSPNSYQMYKLCVHDDYYELVMWEKYSWSQFEIEEFEDLKNSHNQQNYLITSYSLKSWALSCFFSNDLG